MRSFLLAATSLTLLTANAAPAPGVLRGADGRDRGRIAVTATPTGVLLRVAATGLAPGWHGMHFHETGDCGDAAFKAAGGHVHAATRLVHGLLVAGANDAGDLPNLFVAADGSATAEMHSTLVSLDGAGGKPALRDSDGAALVIHDRPDDYRTQPIGGAGARIACAVIP